MCASWERLVGIPAEFVLMLGFKEGEETLFVRMLARVFFSVDAEQEFSAQVMANLMEKIEAASKKTPDGLSGYAQELAHWLCASYRVRDEELRERVRAIGEELVCRACAQEELRIDRWEDVNVGVFRAGKRVDARYRVIQEQAALDVSMLLMYAQTMHRGLSESCSESPLTSANLRSLKSTSGMYGEPSLRTSGYAAGCREETEKRLMELEQKRRIEQAERLDRSARPSLLTRMADAFADLINRPLGKLAASEESEPEEKESAAPPSRAQFRAAAPESVLPGRYFPLTVVMYAPQMRERAAEIAALVAPRRTERETGVFHVPSRCMMRIVLSSPDIPIEEDTAAAMWEGEISTFDYELFLPQDYAAPQVRIRGRVYAGDLVLTDIRLVLDVTSASQQPAVARGALYSAFISYASEDRAHVAARLQGMLAAMPEMDVFFDVESLRRGEEWEERLYREIRERTIFYLFWSRRARASEWVNRELDYAVKTKDMDCIEPIPLEPPDVCPPPQSLEEKHFFDRMLNYTAR